MTKETKLYKRVKKRAGYRCEAFIKVKGSDQYGRTTTYTRCGKGPTEVHHMLTRSRGGLLLDEAGEIAHLLVLCREHHNVAHAPGGHEAGLMINGYVTTGPDGRVVYQGSDRRLAHLRAVDLPEVSQEVPDHDVREGL